jgi:flagellar assembly protein FliH
MTDVTGAVQLIEPAIDLELSLREAHERGQREGRESVRLEMERRLAEERTNISRVVAQFEQEKQSYFAEVENEVVRLSLAIAERVLHREAEMDPTLLAGAAHVALEQVAENSGVVLRVALEDVQRWKETLGMAANKVQIEPDDQLVRGEAILKTRAGTVQLGLKAQLQEIERGFFELLRCRPAMAV